MHARFGVVLVALAATSSALPAAARIRQAPPPLPVIRLEGSAGGPARPASQQTPPAPIGALPVTRLDDRARAADLDAPRTLSVAVSQPRPILDMLVLLVRGTPFSVVASLVGPLFAAYVYDTLGSYNLAFFVIIFCLLISVALLWVARPPTIAKTAEG